MDGWNGMPRKEEAARGWAMIGGCAHVHFARIGEHAPDDLVAVHSKMCEFPRNFGARIEVDFGISCPISLSLASLRSLAPPRSHWREMASRLKIQRHDGRAGGRTGGPVRMSFRGVGCCIFCSSRRHFS